MSASNLIQSALRRIKALENGGGGSGQPLDARLTALAALDATAGVLRQTGSDTFNKLADTAAGRAILEAADAAAQRTALGLGTLATLNTEVAGSTGQVQYNNAGAFGGASNVEVSSNNLVVTTAAPAAPAATKVVITAASIGGRPLLSSRGALDSAVMPVQPHAGWIRRCEWIPIANLTTVTGIGMPNPAPTGTLIARPIAAGSFFSAGRRCGARTSSSSAGLSCGFVQTSSACAWLIGDAAGVGGFHFICRFGVSDAATVANSRLFTGLTASNAAIAGVNPTTLANIIGVGCDAGTTTLSIMHNDASGTATAVALGANFPSQTLSADVYQLELFCAPNGSQVSWVIRRLNTGHTSAGTISSDLPANTTLLYPQLYRNNGITAVQAAIDLFGLYIESDN